MKEYRAEIASFYLRSENDFIPLPRTFTSIAAAFRYAVGFDTNCRVVECESGTDVLAKWREKQREKRV